MPEGKSKSSGEIAWEELRHEAIARERRYRRQTIAGIVVEIGVVLAAIFFAAAAYWAWGPK